MSKVMTGQQIRQANLATIELSSSTAKREAVQDSENISIGEAFIARPWRARRLMDVASAFATLRGGSMSTIRMWSMCAVLIAGLASLAVPVSPAVHAQDNQSAVTFSAEPSNTSYSATACTLAGRPCNPKASTCCPGLKCVFHGGSTRAGYACTLRTALTNSSGELTENKLDRGEPAQVVR